MEPATVAWNAAVQKRVGHTSQMLSQMKGIKMMGLIDHFQALIRSLRVDEVRVSAKFRWLIVWLTTLSMKKKNTSPCFLRLEIVH